MMFVQKNRRSGQPEPKIDLKLTDGLCFINYHIYLVTPIIQ